MAAYIECSEFDFSVRRWPFLLADCMGCVADPMCCEQAGGLLRVASGNVGLVDFLEIFVFGIYARVQNDIRRAKVIVDVGANVGFFAIYASAINPDAQIHSFEPFPDNLTQLKRNLLLNVSRCIHSHPQAVSDKTGVTTLYFTPGDDSGMQP